MKHQLNLIIGTLSLAAAAGSYAQTAVTDPVGYITINVSGNASGYTYSAIAPTLVNKVEFAGTVATIAANGMSIDVTGLTAGAFASGFWIEVTNGAGEGAWTNVTGNTATSITLEDNMAPFITAGTSTIKVRKHVTVGEFFGPTNAAGLKPGADPGQADEVTFIGDRGVGSANVVVFFDAGSSTWNTGDFAPANDLAIEPGEGLLVARKATTPTSFVQVGHVKTGKSMTSILAGPVAGDFGENVVGIHSAVGVTLANSGLFPGLRAGSDPGTADEVNLFINGVPKVYFFDNTTPPGSWFDGDFSPAGNTVLAEGTGLYIVKKGAGDIVWTEPAVTIAP